jgi:hypothetical protein
VSQALDLAYTVFVLYSLNNAVRLQYSAV